MPFCHVSQTFRGGPDLQGIITFIVITIMVALGTLAQGFFVIGLTMILDWLVNQEESKMSELIFFVLGCVIATGVCWWLWKGTPGEKSALKDRIRQLENTIRGQ